MTKADDLYMEGLDRFAEEDWTGALALFEAALTEEPDNLDALHGVARAAFEARIVDPSLLDRSITAATRITELSPHDVTAYSTLSQCYVWKDDKETAEHWGGKARIAGWKQQLREDRGTPG